MQVFILLLFMGLKGLAASVLPGVFVYQPWDGSGAICVCVCVFMGLENALTLAIQTHISPQSPRTSSLHLAYSLPHHAGEFEY